MDEAIARALSHFGSQLSLQVCRPAQVKLLIRRILAWQTRGARHKTGLITRLEAPFFRATSMNPRSGPFSHASAVPAFRFAVRMRRTLFALAIAGSTLAHAADSKTNELPADLTTLSIDDLMHIEVPTVTGAT
jgi:hypothetical protein